MTVAQTVPRRARVRRIHATPSTVPRTTPTLVRAGSPPTIAPTNPNTSPSTTLPTTQPMRMSTTHPTMRPKLRGLLLATLVAAAAILSAACGDDDSPSAEERSVGATSKLSDHDIEIVENIGQYPRRWNETVGPLVRDYIDPEVDADTWLAPTGEQLRDLRVIVVRLQSDVLRISDGGVRAVFGDIVTNYKRKLAALTSLVAAVRAGDTDVAEAASSELNAAAMEGQDLAVRLIDRLRPFIDPDELSRKLGERAKDLEDLFGGK